MAETFSVGDRVRFLPACLKNLFGKDAKDAAKLIDEGVVGIVTGVYRTNICVQMKRSVWQMDRPHLERVADAQDSTGETP